MLRGTDNHKSEISIHAPTRGATLPILPCRQDNSISIHAPTRGATQSKLMPIADMTLFQSTLPREERHCLIVKTSLYSYFNPRSHERSDLKRCKYMRYKIISIHAPTRGATFSLNEVLRCPDISIHAPTRGATALLILCRQLWNISIHAPTRGATLSGSYH